MEVYLIVPRDPKTISLLYKICTDLFSRNSDKVFLFSSFDERHTLIARTIALAIGCDLRIDTKLSSSETVSEFTEKHFWPNHFIEILVVSKEIAETIAKQIDPGCGYQNIPTDTFFRLKDIFPEEKSDDEDVD